MKLIMEMKTKSKNDGLFWSDQLAEQIISRKKFHYVDREIPKFAEYTVKTSASLSGVLHIGRLSDTVRGESVAISLRDKGVKVRFIWVAEDMDPFRKIPSGVPAEYSKYLGMPVTDVPDVEGCHSSYADHHLEEYFKVIDNFVFTKLEKFSMREEYRKGSFKPYIKKILDNIESVKEIQNKYRSNKLGNHYSPWAPICDNCGKIVTPRVTDVVDSRVVYTCKDYEFETTKAVGCKHKGENDPMKGNGKLMWKSEWASQCSLWKVVSEGAGKEYQVPNSAWWINGEISERIHDYPMPIPIFYEHIMIDNAKMSAYLGNVIYPKDWLEVAGPELLRLFYNKRLMTTRSFSWSNLPQLYDEYDYMAKIYLGKIKLENEKEELHYKRLFRISNLNEPEEPLEITFSHAAIIAQVFSEEKDAVKSMERTGQYKKEFHKRIFERIRNAKVWLDKYAPDDSKFILQKEVSKDLKLSTAQKEAVNKVADAISKKEFTDKELHNEFYNICKPLGLNTADFFKAAYLVLFNKERGPKLAA